MVWFGYRVEFPYFLNINGYLCEEAKTLLSKQETVLEQSVSPINDGQSSDRSIKGDDASTADSASTVEDEGCQAAGTLHGSTSGSNSSGSNIDMQVLSKAKQSKNDLRLFTDHPNESCCYRILMKGLT